LNLLDLIPDSSDCDWTLKIKRKCFSTNIMMKSVFIDQLFFEPVNRRTAGITLSQILNEFLGDFLAKNFLLVTKFTSKLLNMLIAFNLRLEDEDENTTSERPGGGPG
jgi:hypothetical protein